MSDQRNVVGLNAMTPSSSTTPLVTNLGRVGVFMQNQGTNPLFIALGPTAASNAAYHIVLKGGTAVADGNGGVFSMLSGNCFTGQITTSGTAASFTYFEL